MQLNVERKSRIIIGILALVSVMTFFLFSFGSTNFLPGIIATGVIISALIYAESGIVGWISKGKYKTFTFADVMVIFGFIVGTAVLVFSISLIPAVGEALPQSVIDFTSSFAKVISGLLVIIIGIFMITPKFE